MFVLFTLLFLGAISFGLWGLISPSSMSKVGKREMSRKDSALGFGLFALVALILMAVTAPPTKNVAAKASPSSSTSSTPKKALTPTPTPSPSPTASAGSTGQNQTDSTNALTEAKSACSSFESGVDPILQASVSDLNLAPDIRIHMGEPAAASGPVDANAPFFVMVNSANSAASDDPKYQPLDDAVNALGPAIIHQDPSSNDFSAISQAAASVSSQCSSI